MNTSKRSRLNTQFKSLLSLTRISRFWRENYLFRENVVVLHAPHSDPVRRGGGAAGLLRSDRGAD